MSKQKVYKDGTIEWVISGGQRHRINGHAVEWLDGTKGWYIVRSVHRLNDPAVIFNGSEANWYLNSKPHRINGPFSERIGREERWYIGGKRYTESEYNRIMKVPAPPEES